MDISGYFTEERNGVMKITSLLIGELYKKTHKQVIDEINLFGCLLSKDAHSENSFQIKFESLFKENFEIGFYDILKIGLNEQIYYITPIGFGMYLDFLKLISYKTQNN